MCDIKKHILSQHTKNKILLMDICFVNQFDDLFDNILMILKLKHGLHCEVLSHHFLNVTLYARNTSGDMDFGLRIDSIVNLKNLNKDYLKIQYLSGYGMYNHLYKNQDEFVFRLCEEKEILKKMKDIVDFL